MFKNAIYFQKDDKYSVINLTGDNCIFNNTKENLQSKSKCGVNMKKASIWINNHLKDNDIIFVANSSVFENFFNKDLNSYDSNEFNDFYYSSNRLNYLKEYVKNLENFLEVSKKSKNFIF